MPDLYNDTSAASDTGNTTQDPDKYVITEEGVIKLASEILEVVDKKIEDNISQTIDGDDETSSVTGKAVNAAIKSAIAELRAEIDAGYWRITDINPISNDTIINSVNNTLDNLYKK